MSLTHISTRLARGELRFRAAVYDVVRAIPEGKVLGYGHVAAILGRPRAARQVGYALAALDDDARAPDGERVPWWRVTRSDGSVAMQGDSTRGPRQLALLATEGVVPDRGRIDMKVKRWDAPVD